MNANVTPETPNRESQLRHIANLSQQGEQSSSTQNDTTATTNVSFPESTPKKRRKIGKTIFNIIVYCFALAGFGIIGAWAFYQLGGTKNKGGVDENIRYLMSDAERSKIKKGELSHEEANAMWVKQYARLAAFGKFYPENAKLILEAALRCDDPTLVDRMINAASVYAGQDKEYADFMNEASSFIDKKKQANNGNIIPWMDTPEWEALKPSIMKDSAALNKAGQLCGVEPRLIVACLVGEQIRLFNSNREMFKKYLGPVKVLSVQSQFSWGVNGIKEFTAVAVENHLKDPNSEFYMGKCYENILDFKTNDHSNERFRRLVDYQNHLYSYLYTGCILHQTMMQWKRAGFDISNRPDILCTLFNVGFSQSHPHDNPVCGGSHIRVAGNLYTFGTIGFDFYYSGELADAFPYWKEHFRSDNGQSLSQQEIEKIQSNTSQCRRPEKGIEYRQDSASGRNLPDGVVREEHQVRPAWDNSVW